MNPSLMQNIFIGSLTLLKMNLLPGPYLVSRLGFLTLNTGEKTLFELVGMIIVYDSPCIEF